MKKKPDQLVVELQSKMFANAVRVSDACKRTDPPISPSTWSRWAAGGPPDVPTFRRLEKAVDEIISEDA